MAIAIHTLILAHTLPSIASGFYIKDPPNPDLRDAYDNNGSNNTDWDVHSERTNAEFIDEESVIDNIENVNFIFNSRGPRSLYRGLEASEDGMLDLDDIYNEEDGWEDEDEEEDLEQQPSYDD